MKNTMFCNNITNIDFAYFNENNEIRGESLAMSASISGELNGEEAVVIDFSACKKMLKKIADDLVDHRLVVFHDFIAAEDLNISKNHISNKKTNELYIFGTDTNFIQEIPIYGNPDGIQGWMGQYLSDKCSEIISAELNSTYDIKVHLYHHMIAIYNESDMTVGGTFHYTHGLRNSTSFGCQNIMHGHASFIQVFYNDEASYDMVSRVVEEITESLDNSYIVNANYVQESVISYNSNRGFWLIAKPPKMCVMYEEPTIENIAMQVAKLWKDKLLQAGVYAIEVSEGLDKGARVYLNEA